MPKRGREIEDDGSAVAIIDAPPLVTVKVMKGTEATSVKVDPSKYGFLRIQLQDEAYAQQFINTDEVIADLSAAELGPELAADIATTMDVADGRLDVTNVRLAAQTLRGADYLQLREELYLEQVVTVLSQAARKDSDAPPTSSKEVVPCVHTGQLMWDRLGAYNVLRLEQMGIISLGHKGTIHATDERIDDTLLALASVLNKVTSLDISCNESITTCQNFADTLVELKAARTEITDEGLMLCTKLRKLDVSYLREVTSCVPFAETLEELVANGHSGITDASLECCRKIRKLWIINNPCVTTLAPFADTLEELNVWGSECNITDASLKCCRKIRKLCTCMNPDVTTLAPFADTLEELKAGGEGCGITLDAIQGCTKLRKLFFFGTPEMTTCESCESLKDLEELTPYYGFTEASLQRIAEQCTGLIHLDLSCCRKVLTNALLTKFTENCRHLQSLNLTNGIKLTDSSIMALAQNLPQLRSLNVAGAEAITDTAIIKLAENCPKLEDLNVKTSSNITDVSIKKVAEHCPRLQRLNVGLTEGNITNASIVEIAKNCPSLVYLNALLTEGKIGGDVLKLLPPATRCLLIVGQ